MEVGRRKIRSRVDPSHESPTMKHNHNHDNAPGIDPLVPVRFEFSHPTAKTVSVAGTFNDWHPTTKSMHPSGEGHWLKQAFLPPGSYEYCLVVDGRWIPDPRAQSDVANPFGGRNSILKVGSPPDAVPITDARNLPMENANI